MSTPFLSNQAIQVNSAFNDLRAALEPTLAALSPQQRAVIQADLEKEIAETHQAILHQVGALEQTAQAAKIALESTTAVEWFDEAAYLDKLKLLLSYGDEVNFQPLKNPPRDGEWIGASHFIKHKLGKFFKMMLIWGNNKTTGKQWPQGIIVQEFEQYDKHACHKEIGRITLPIRFVDGQILAGITIKNPPGSYGQPIFTAPRTSHSNETKPIFYDMPGTIHSEPHRHDAWRLTGKSNNRVILIQEEVVSQIDPVKEKIVWFNLAELKRLLDEPQSEDAPTIAIARWLLLNAADLQRKFQSNSG